ncbi:S8 family peptidase [Methylomonas sp. SURF-2]|uniref:S8 family peptidase n=1 Tax=Methylomonas subterranea TaxID=2952225 RepID=A0ABT1TEB3_9GAMM|nr:S8 family peptidase [Methylomonas sp. SURF-2]MCQ8103796.1 S8 family peptidase [Methylomonas sp. SURF-2]
MAELPLLIFPQAKIVDPPKGRAGFPPLNALAKQVQISRLTPQFETLEKQFRADQAILSASIAGIEPEMVLVIETAGRLEDFQRAIANTPGLEWLAEWDEEFEPDEYFFNKDSKQQKTDKLVEGRLYLAMTNQQGLSELLALWNQWQKTNDLPPGKAKWRDVFSQIKVIRRWGIQEQLIETGVLDIWREDLEYEDTAHQLINFQVEFFYRRDRQTRKQNEAVFKTLLKELSGQLISPFLEYPEIGFHAAKAQLTRNSIQSIVEKIDRNELDINLLKLPSIMFFRPTGQSLTSSPDETAPIEAAPEYPVRGDPIVAILDGVPFSQHTWLKDRLILDDADELENEYQPGNRKHGTAMASLVIHGELDANELPLTRPVYFRPIMQPNPHAKNRVEHVPDEVFYEDRIERAVRRMFEGEGDVPAQADTVKIINLSFGDPSRMFIHTLSPCAKLLDWLSWKYKVLFCVSTGNINESIDLGVSEDEFNCLSDAEKTQITLTKINETARHRRIISPAESLNSITVGASHSDSSTISYWARRVDILPETKLFSPTNCLGHGFRRSIKPDILLPGGQQLFNTPPIGSSFKLSESILSPGQKVAVEGQPGDQSASSYTRGSSNATALASRAGAKIYEVIDTLRQQTAGAIQENQIAVLIKALLVHSASREGAEEALDQHLKTPANSRQFKSYASKFIGYGNANISRVLACTEQRATVIGCGHIGEKQVHEYRFPLPPSLANSKQWRRLTITLAWFTPINPNHRYLRQAKLFFEAPKNTDLLGLSRQEAEWNQVRRGTVQHEILESSKVSYYQDGDELVIPVQCNSDAVDKLDEQIPYALAVTMEVKEGISIPIYQEIRSRIQTQIKIEQR